MLEGCFKKLPRNSLENHKNWARHYLLKIQSEICKKFRGTFSNTHPEAATW